MKKKISNDITDEELDDLFNNNNTSVLEDSSESDEEESELKQTDMIPKEISTETEGKSAKFVDRPKIQVKSEDRRIKEEISKLDDFSEVRKIVQQLRNYKENEKLKNATTKAIMSGLTPVNFDRSTKCRFHIYQPKDVLRDGYLCSCKFCSACKEFTNREWEEYCIKYRKWF